MESDKDGPQIVVRLTRFWLQTCDRALRVLSGTFTSANCHADNNLPLRFYVALSVCPCYLLVLGLTVEYELNIVSQTADKYYKVGILSGGKNMIY